MLDKMLKTLKTKKTRNILLVIILAIASVLYLLADRYLIEHVEGKAILATESGATIPETASNLESDDWNYKSDNITININKVQTGQGNDTVTYFVADVQLSDSSSLKSAFAKDEYGRNIVEKTSQIAADSQRWSTYPEWRFIPG